MWPYWLAIGLLALAAGGLFRAADLTGRGMWRMWAWIALLAAGLVANLALVRAQLRDGRRRVRDAFRGLGAGFSVVEPGVEGPPGEGGQYAVIAPAGVVALVLDEMPNSTRLKPALRHAQASQAAAAALADRIRAAAARALSPEDLASLAVEPLLVLTRRRAADLRPRLDPAVGVVVVNPEELHAHLRRWEAPEAIERAQRLALRNAIQRAR